MEVVATQKMSVYNASGALESGRYIDAGITDGTNPMRLISRHQAAIMALRAHEMQETEE